MSQAWAPVITTAIIVLGVVGGRIAHTLIKRIIPLVETLVMERQKGISAADSTALRRQVAELRTELAELRGHGKRLDGIEECLQFLQSLLKGRPAQGQLRAGGGD